ncbi:tetratricopeptide repeat protein [Niabella terrae]
MKKPQLFILLAALLVLVLLWAFGSTVSHKKVSHEGHNHDAPAVSTDLSSSSFSIDSALISTKKALNPAQSAFVSQLEENIGKAPGGEEKIHAYHQLSQYFKDSVRAFLPFAWYTAEAARLENSEKNLNFAGHLFLNNVQEVHQADMKQWMALQAKDLFERSLNINPQNDSAKVGLGATYMFGGISNAPMQGISKIREVIDKDSTNVYAQMTLAMGSLMSGQTDKALQRLLTVHRLDGRNLQAVLLLADLYERQGDKNQALQWYSKALPLITDHDEMKTALQERINTLKN